MLTENDNLLVYYAGHGHWEQQIQRGIGCPLIAILTAMSIGSPRLLSLMSSVRCLPGMCSSCLIRAYSGALTRSALARLEAGMSNEARDHWLKSMAEKRSRTVLSSGGLQPVLDDGGGNHSVFAKAFGCAHQ